MNDIRDKLPAILGAVVLFLSGVGLCVTLEDDGDITVTKKAPPALPAGVQPDADHNRDAEQVKESSAEPVSEPGVAPSPELTLENVGPEIEEDMVDETPPGISEEEALEAHVTPPNPLPNAIEYKPQPVGGANDFTCRYNPVRNYSPRAVGVRTSMFVLHFTVSPPGSLRGIWNMFNTPSFAASSHYLLELNGQCEQIVPFSQKSWTEGAFNSASESVEIVTNDLTRNEWLSSSILKNATLAKMTVSRLKANGLPDRHVDPDGCSPQAGVTDHNALECGNFHWDVGPGFPWDKFMVQVHQIYRHGTLCDTKCHRLNRVQRRHKATHADYQRVGCRGRMHKVRLRDLKTDQCRAIKKHGHEQHLRLRRIKSS